VHSAAKSEATCDGLSTFDAKQMPGRDAQLHADITDGLSGAA
jgi:hypothetical protein